MKLKLYSPSFFNKGLKLTYPIQSEMPIKGYQQFKNLSVNINKGKKYNFLEFVIVFPHFQG